MNFFKIIFIFCSQELIWKLLFDPFSMDVHAGGAIGNSISHTIEFNKKYYVKK
jgi:hypothetical protein